MRVMKISALIVLALGLCVGLALSSSQATQPQTAAAASKQLGTIKSITGNTILLAPDSGPPVAVQVGEDRTIQVR